MRDNVNVDPGTKRLMEAFAPSTVNDFFNGEVRSRRVLTMKQGCGNPNFIGNLQLGESSLILHKFLFVTFLHHD
jgi:hypothetical protein